MVRPPESHTPLDRAPERSDHRRRRTAGSALTAILVAFVLGILFNAAAMKKTAMELPFGTARSVRLTLIEPVAALSGALRLDRPARYAAQALGKPDPGLVADAGRTPSPGPSPSERPRLTAAEKPLRKPYKGHPLHLYIAGDSIAGIPGMALVNVSKRTKLIKPELDYQISSGLVRPDFFDWPAKLRQRVDEFRPGAVVLMFGANDSQGIQTDSGDVFQFGTEGWDTEYRKRIREVLGILSDGGVQRVYWIGQPPMADGALDRHLRQINAIVRSEAEGQPGVEFIDAAEALGNGGAYAQYLKDESGRTEQVREGDGTHMTYAGGVRLAELVMKSIAADWLTEDKP